MNRRIDHSNYEAWLLDRLEGSLSPEQERQLDAFLAANPGLDIDDGDLPSLADPEVALSQADKDALKRSLPPAGMPGEPIDDFLIARLEGDLTAVQDEALRHYLPDHPEHQRTERIYAHSKLVPLVQQYADKAALHRQLPPIGLPTRHTLDDHLVARMEGDLDPEQERALSAYIASDPAAQRAWALMQHARIVPRPVVYADKEGLRKGGRVIAIGAGGVAWRMVFRAAAVIAILLTSGIWIIQRGPQQGPEFAVRTDMGEEGRSPSGSVRTEAGAGNGDGAQVAPIVPGQDATVGSPSSEGMVPVQFAAQGGTQADKEMERTSPVHYAQPRPVITPVEVPRSAPLERSAPQVEIIAFAGFKAEQDKAAAQEGVRLLDLLAGKLRKRVLDAPTEELRPFGSDDAFAALDKGLRKVGGDASGLDVELDPSGQLHRFDLRLGRNLAISANR